MSEYRVVVSFFGTVHCGDNLELATIEFEECMDISLNSSYSGMSGEDVTLFKDGKVIREFIGYLRDDE